MKTIAYDFPQVGCYVDESAGSADDCNRRTIEFAECYGFNPGAMSGVFDGLRGLAIEMSMDEAESASHQGCLAACLVWRQTTPENNTESKQSKGHYERIKTEQDHGAKLYHGRN